VLPLDALWPTAKVGGPGAPAKLLDALGRAPQNDRWHAERPCGLREWQRRHRGA